MTPTTRMTWRLLVLTLALTILAGCRENGSAGGDVPPAVQLTLDWSTFWGGAGGDGATRGHAIAVSPAGEVVVVGETQSPSFFVKNPVPQPPRSGSKGFVTRFNAGGRQVVYSSKLGSGGGSDWCTAVAIDAAGNALVAGLAGGGDFPLQDPLYPQYTADWECGFLCSIPPAGGGLNFSTLIPHGVPSAVAVGGDGAIYLATSNNHVLKLAADGSRLLYDFRVGDENVTSIMAIAVDGSGRAWVAGISDYSFTPLLNPLQPGTGVHNDELLLARIDAAGSRLDFSTLLGGSGMDYAKRIAIGGDGMVTVLGGTTSPDFPVSRAVDPSWGGDVDGLLVRIDPGKSRIVYATYVGGDGEDRGCGLAVTASGETWVSGLTTSSDLPVTGSYQDRLAGIKDAFLGKLSVDGRSWRALSYFGGSLTSGHSETGADWCNDLCLDAGGAVLLTGETFSSDFPLKDALDPVYSLPKAFVSAFRLQ